MVATGQEIVREKFFKIREMSRNFILGQGKLAFEEKSGKIKIVGLIYSARRATVSTKPRFLMNFLYFFDTLTKELNIKVGIA